MADEGHSRQRTAISATGCGSLWRRLKLGEMLSLQRGYDLPAAERKPGEFPLWALPASLASMTPL